MRRIVIALVVGMSARCVEAPSRGGAAGSGDATDAGALGPLKPATSIGSATRSMFDPSGAGASAGVGGAGGSSAARSIAGSKGLAGSAGGKGGTSGGAAAAAISGDGDAGMTAPPPDDPKALAGAAASMPPLHPAPSAPGQLVISELMIDPKTLSDSEGEWFELANLSGAALDLRGCLIEDGDKMHPIADSVLVPANGYITIARSKDPGFSPDYVAALSFTNSADSIGLRCADVEIDRVAYDKARGYAVTSGASLSLDPKQLSAAANDLAAAWCAATESYGPELGTPGRPNPSCDVAIDAGVFDPGATDAATEAAALDAALADPASTDPPPADPASVDAASAIP